MLNFMMLSREIWVFIFLLGLLFLNWPFIHIFNMSLPYHLFGTWVLFILTIRILVSFVKERDTE